MNYDRLIGSGLRPYRVLAWALAWFLLIGTATTCTGMNGWPWRFTSLQPYLLRDAGDNWLYNAFSIYATHDADSQKLTKIVYVGGSVCLEGLPSDRWMEAELNKRLDRRVHFVSICSPYQNFADEARIVDALGSFGGILILGTEPAFFAKVAERQFQARPDSGKAGGNGYFYLPIEPGLAVIARDQGININAFSDIWQFWNMAPRALAQATRRALRNGPITLQRHRIKSYRNLDYEEVANKFIGNYHTSVVANEALRRAAIRSALDSGNRVVLLEIPNDEDLIGLFDPLREDYSSRIESMVHDFSVEYLRPQSSASWTRQDFFDTHHLSPAGREKFAAVLADLLTPLIERY